MQDDIFSSTLPLTPLIIYFLVSFFYLILLTVMRHSILKRNSRKLSYHFIYYIFATMGAAIQIMIGHSSIIDADNWKEIFHIINGYESVKYATITFSAIYLCSIYKV